MFVPSLLVLFICCAFRLHRICCAQQLPYYTGAYPSYSNLGGYRPNGFSPFSSSIYGRSSYAYVSPYTGYGGLSGYEGPPYGLNTYWQPGVAYPPYNAYAGGAGFPGNYGCRDRSTDCALFASTGQCAYGAALSSRMLCPQSCGYGCAGFDLPYASASSPYYGTATPSAYGGGTAYAPAQYHRLRDPLNAQQSGYYGGQSYASTDYGGQSYGGIGADYGSAALPSACRDSHIFGCPQWASQGFCQQVPEYMMNYCRGSCGVCAGYGNPAGNGYGSAYGNGGNTGYGNAYGNGYGATNGYGSSTYGVAKPYSNAYENTRGNGHAGNYGGGIGYSTGSGYDSIISPYGSYAGIDLPYITNGFEGANTLGTPLGTSGGQQPLVGPTLGSGVLPPLPSGTFPESGGVPLSAFGSPALSSIYAPFGPFRSLGTSSASSSASALAHEKRQKGAKVLFSEDSDADAVAAPLGGLAQPSTSIFDQPSSAQLFNNDAMLNWLPASSHKTLRMDDLLLADKQRKKNAKH